MYKQLRSGGNQAKVLVIEDNSDHWLLMRKAMQQYMPGVVPVRVDSADQALVLLNEWSTQEWELPKLIFQDLYLPTCQEGWDLLKQIKAMILPCRSIPVVMLSASNRPDDITESYNLGIACFLTKPLDFSDWLTSFKELHTYWWETVTLPPVQFYL